MKTLDQQRGLSLIELMIAMTIGLMITITLGYVLMGSRSTYRAQDANARVQDTGRFAMELIGKQLMTAGRPDITPLAMDQNNTFTGDAITIIDGVAGAKVEEHVGAVSYLAQGGVEKTRFVDSFTVSYQASSMGGADIADCNGMSGEDLTPAGLPEIVAGSGIRRGTVTNTIALNQNDDQVWELRCDGNGGAAQPVAEGVEDLQIRYGLDTSGDLAVDEWVDAPTAAQLLQIIAADVCILVRSMEAGVVPVAQTVTDCSGATYVANDTSLYRTFRQAFALRNRINAAP